MGLPSAQPHPGRIDPSYRCQLLSASVSIAAMRSCVQLRCLRMPRGTGDNRHTVSSLSPLAACRQLEELWMARNFQFISLAPLKALPKLRKLDLRGCQPVLLSQVADLQLSACPHLAHPSTVELEGLVQELQPNVPPGIQQEAARYFRNLARSPQRRTETPLLVPFRYWFSCGNNLLHQTCAQQQLMRYASWGSTRSDSVVCLSSVQQACAREHTIPGYTGDRQVGGRHHQSSLLVISVRQRAGLLAGSLRVTRASAWKCKACGESDCGRPPRPASDLFCLFQNLRGPLSDLGHWVSKPLERGLFWPTRQFRHFELKFHAPRFISQKKSPAPISLSAPSLHLLRTFSAPSRTRAQG
jgi:hypothetical protein